MPNNKLPPLPPFKERREQSKPDIRTCAVCRQSYDARDLRQAHHHTAEPHQPLEPAAV